MAVVRVLQEDAVVSSGFKMEGDVSTRTRFESGKLQVGWLCEGHSVPGVSYDQI